MRFVSSHGGKLQFLAEAGLAPGRNFATGLGAIDRLAPGGCFARGAIHELLYAPCDAPPAFFAAVLARGAGQKGSGFGSTALTAGRVQGSPCAIIWCDPRGEL